MNRRNMLAGLAASALVSADTPPASPKNTYLELKTWRFHNSPENQSARTADYLEHGLAPALSRAGARLDGAFSNVIGPDGPYYVTLTQFSSLGTMQDVLAKLTADEQHQQALQKLSSGSGLPFVRVDSSLLRSFDGMPEPAVSAPSGKSARIFELRTYESQTFVTLARKVGMFNSGEMGIFQRLEFRPVFFGETIIGSSQPNLTYMLSYDNLSDRDRLWRAFGSDPEWKKLVSQPELKDSEIVANISNVILAPLRFSAIQ
ncbi:MAG TPA: NIPSNAP family protein [Bryobacteraceae bacterium]|nr:NIPSNAP family protein [Bryobacteraceae bacterium]